MIYPIGSTVWTVLHVDQRGKPYVVYATVTGTPRHGFVLPVIFSDGTPGYLGASTVRATLAEAERDLALLVLARG